VGQEECLNHQDRVATGTPIIKVIKALAQRRVEKVEVVDSAATCRAGWVTGLSSRGTRGKHRWIFTKDFYNKDRWKRLLGLNRDGHGITHLGEI